METPETQSNLPRAKAGRLRCFVRLLVACVTFLIWIWCIAFAYCLDDFLFPWLAYALAAAVAIGIPVVAYRFRFGVGKLTLLVGAVFVCFFVVYSNRVPMHDRNWDAAQSRLPYASYPIRKSNQVATVHNIRSFRYGPSRSEENYYDDSYDLSKLKRVWFGVDRFTDFEPLAHTFISFEFEPGEHRTNFLAFSVETRREADEIAYSPIRGIFKNYETIYVIADEQDVLSVRSDVREHVVQLYPLKSEPERARQMFRLMIGRANQIKQQPEFYDTLTNNCTNNIVFHTNQVLDTPISAWQRGVVFPGYSDWLAHQKGLIDTELSLEDARVKFRIDQRVKSFDGSEDFSTFIRRTD